jgi:predicted ABC-type ATPase
LNTEYTCEDAPTLLVFAGPNGSGKSTAAKGIDIAGVYVNADDIKREYGLTNLEAAKSAEQLREALLLKKSDFTFETVLSTKRNLDLMKRAAESGYEVICIYVLTCDADINVARVMSRVASGGHEVPEDKIRSRYSKALKLIPELIPVCDKILIYDNSALPELIFYKDKSEVRITANEYWSDSALRELVSGKKVTAS